MSSKQMQFTLHKNHVLQSVLGHTIEFKKGEPTFVPRDLWDAAMGIGAMPTDELPETKAEESKEPATRSERREAIFAGFDALILENKRESFMGTGAPHVKALAAKIGFSIDANERDEMWLDFKTAPKDE